MSLTVLLTTNFQIQYDPAEFSGPGELSAVQARAQVFVTGCERDYSTMCPWFGTAVGEGFGPSNRVIVTLTKNVRGAVNFGYSTHQSRMSVNPEIGASDDFVLGLFVAEMSEILMSYKGRWNAGNSTGEGLSRVAAQLLHPQYGNGFVNAWLAADPTTDPTSAVADSQFRKDWVSQNFTGGPLKAGGNVGGDDDSYSYGCAMLFIYYLKSQLGFSMPQIVQNGGATLADTYQALTKNGQTRAFWEFKSLLAQHFPSGVQSPTDDPFPLEPIHISTNVAPGAGASGNTTALVVTNNDQRIYYKWWDLGQGAQIYGELEGDGRTDAAPAAALVGPQHNYLFVAVKGLDGNLYLNQGELGKPLVGWEYVNFQAGFAPGLASSGNITVVVTVSPDGRIFYDWWQLGQGGRGFTELTGDGRTNAAPAAALVGPQNNYLFAAVKGLDGNLYLNQGELGKPLVGWEYVNFQAGFAPGLASSGNITAVVAVSPDGRIFYDWWQLGQGGHGFRELEGGGRTNAAPAAALVGPDHNYLFVVVKGLDGNIYLNQGELGKPFVGWL